MLQPQDKPQVILELAVRNHPGVMSHVCGLFARRAFNVEGILCLPLKDGQQSRIWLLVADDQRLEQMISGGKAGRRAAGEAPQRRRAGI